MFYSPQLLKKNGRFALVWIAATRCRVLSKRELMAVNIAITATDILQHVPGELARDVGARPRRFSLYLSSQLMYGSVKILFKQWEFLLSDIAALRRRFHPESPGTMEIDLIVARPEPVTLQSCVPASIRDKCFDPFFGICKENTTDVEALLEIWDADYVRQETFILETSSGTYRAEIGSPHSVSDARQIQIKDADVTFTSSPEHVVQASGQDIPPLGADGLAFIQNPVQEIQIPSENQDPVASERTLREHEQDLEEILQLTRQQIIEETPASKPKREQPGTPRKSKRKRPKGGDEDKADDTHGTQMVENIEERAQVAEEQVQQEHISSPQQSPRPQLLSPEQPALENPQRHPSFQLSPIPPSPSPLRKKRPHKLIIDEDLQISKATMRQNLESSSETCTPLEVCRIHKRNYLKEPSSNVIGGPRFKQLWTRNCKFGLRVSEPLMEETSKSSENSSSDSPRHRRRNIARDFETPVKLRKTDSMLSQPEKGRDNSAISAPNESRERSQSLVALASDDSTANISEDKHQQSTHSNADKTAPDVSLAPLPEEQEQILSPVQITEFPQQADHSTSGNERLTSDSSEVHEDNVLELVRETAQRGNLTTFRAICPPNSSSKRLACKLFLELVCQVGNAVLGVQQDEPYGEILIWEI